MTKHHTKRALRLALCGSLSALLAGTATCAIAAAGLWQASKVSGHAWTAAPGTARTALQAGMEVPDGVTVFTDDRTRVMLVRGSEFMVVGPRSALAVSPSPEPGMDTTVLQRAGTVTFDVAKQSGPHFSVETPILAAVVKGTHFTVHVSGARANVAVARGLVGVTNLSTGQSADISPGQRADGASGPHGGLSVSGTGSLPSITHGLPRASVVAAAMAPSPATAVAEAGSFVATTSAEATQAPNAVSAAQSDPSSTSVSHATGTGNSNRSGTPAASVGAPAASTTSSAVGSRSASTGAGSTGGGRSGGSNGKAAGQSGSDGGSQGNGKAGGPGQSSGKGADGKGNASGAGVGQGAGAGASGNGKATGGTGATGGGLGSSAGAGKAQSNAGGSAKQSPGKGEVSTGAASKAGTGNGAGQGNSGGNRGH